MQNKSAKIFFSYPYPKPHHKPVLRPAYHGFPSDDSSDPLSQHFVFSASYHKGLNVEYEASSTVLSIKTCSIHSVFFLPFQILLSIHEIILHTPEFLPQRVKVIAPGRPSQMLRNIQEFSILEVSGIRAYEEMPKMAFKKNSRF